MHVEINQPGHYVEAAKGPQFRVDVMRATDPEVADFLGPVVSAFPQPEQRTVQVEARHIDTLTRPVGAVATRPTVIRVPSI